jgi:hypothetical protein
MDELRLIYKDMLKNIIYDANHRTVKTTAGYEVKETNKSDEQILASLAKKLTKITIFTDGDIVLISQKIFAEDTACKLIAYYAKDHFPCNNISQLKVCYYDGEGAFNNLDDETLDKIVRYARQMC